MKLVTLGNGFSVFRRADGRFVAKWRDSQNRPRQSTFRKAVDANAFCRRKYREWPGRITPTDYAVLELMADYMTDREEQLGKGLLGENTLIRDRAGARRIVDYWGRTPAASLGRLDVKRWHTALAAEGLSDSTVSNYSSVLRSAYNWAMETGALAELDGHPVPKVAIREQRSGQALTWPETRGILGRVPDVYQAFTQTLAYSGMRIEEVCRLDVGDFDPEAGTVTGGIKTEAGRGRILRVPSYVAEAIVAHLGPRTEGPLFLNRRGERVKADVYRRRVWKPAVEAAGIPEATPHWLRHSLATYAAHAGMTTHQLNAQFGWASSRSGDRYVKPAREAVTAIGDLLEDQVPAASTGGIAR